MQSNFPAMAARYVLMYAFSCCFASCAVYGISWTHADGANEALASVTRSIVANRETEVNEKMFFLLSVSGFVLLAALRSRLSAWTEFSSAGPSLAAAGLLFITLQVAVGQAVTTGSRVGLWLIVGFSIVVYVVLRRLRQAGSAGNWGYAAETYSNRLPHYLIGLGAFCGLLLVLLVPASIDHVVAGVGANTHVVSFFIGPALYEKFSNAIPGVDYHTHYSQLAGVLFRPLVADTVLDTYRNYVWMMLAAVYMYYVSAFLYASYALRHVRCAIVVTLVAFLLNFQTEFSHFFGPSAWPVRFPLLNVVGMALLWLMSQPDARFRQLVLGALLAISVLIMSETGIYMVSACVGTGLLLVRGRRVLLTAGVGALASFVVIFYTVSVGVFGLAAISWAFHFNLVEALLIYGATGWVSVPLKWTISWSLVYNFLLPSLLLATVVAARIAHSMSIASRTILTYCSLMGLLFHLKWLNTSHDAVIHQSIFPALVVVGWYVVVASRSAVLNGRKQRAGMVLVAGLMAAGGTVSTVNDSRQPAIPHGLWSYVGYPSFLKSAISEVGEESMESWGDITNPKILDFIRRNTAPGERLYLVANNDWAYLLETQRAPGFYFTPSTATFSFRHLEQSIDNMNRFYVIRGSDFHYKEIRDVSLSVLQKQFLLSARSEFVDIYRRK